MTYELICSKVLHVSLRVSKLHDMNNVLESDVLLNNFSRIKTYGSSSAGDECSTNINRGPCKSL